MARPLGRWVKLSRALLMSGPSGELLLKEQQLAYCCSKDSRGGGRGLVQMQSGTSILESKELTLLGRAARLTQPS